MGGGSLGSNDIVIYIIDIVKIAVNKRFWLSPIQTK